jgi:hypothetical protein
MVPLPNGKDLHAVGRVCSKLRAAAMRPFRLSARLILEIDISERLPASVPDNKARGLFVDRPGRGEAAAGSRNQVAFRQDPPAGYRRRLKLIRTPAIKSAQPSTALTRSR